ncbi:MAG: phosphodiester glycosidase family protein [Clostridia bacterium]|nr:phosphodiester glycosidase family protein [Clostridia bacterium]
MRSGQKLALMLIVDAIAFILISLAILTNSFNWFNVHGTDEPVALATPVSQSGDASDINIYASAGDSVDAETPDPNASANPTDGGEQGSSATSTPEITGLCGNRFPDKFSYNGIIQTDTRYASENIDIEVTYYEVEGVHYQVADIYIQDINCFKTWYDGENKYHTYELAPQVGAIVAVNGDMAINSSTRGWIVRNGLEYHNKELSEDICILYWDGEMETYNYKTDTIDYDAIYARGPYQIWYFGPELLDDGQPMTSFNSSVNPKNPRTVVGYYEPGHYAFIVVEGKRDGGDSEGYSLVELSQLCYDLGLKVAYNLDGGGSAAMWYNNVTFAHDSRGTSDILYIAEIPTA